MTTTNTHHSLAHTARGFSTTWPLPWDLWVFRFDPHSAVFEHLIALFEHLIWIYVLLLLCYTCYLYICVCYLYITAYLTLTICLYLNDNHRCIPIIFHLHPLLLFHIYLLFPFTIIVITRAFTAPPFPPVPLCSHFIPVCILLTSHPTGPSSCCLSVSTRGRAPHQELCQRPHILSTVRLDPTICFSRPE